MIPHLCKWQLVRLYALCIALGALAGCASSSAQHKEVEAIARRNPLDMADEDAKVIKVGGKPGKKQDPPKVPMMDAREAPFISGKKSKIYHARNCEYAGKLDSPVGFSNCDDAERSGRIPCEFCKPREQAGK